MSLEKKYPKLFGLLEDTTFVDSPRDLVVVDENYDDIDSDEFDVFDPSDYNFLVYITPRVQDALGEKGIGQLVKRLESDERFEDFFASEIDMYGIKVTDMDEESIGDLIIKVIEEELL